LEGNGTVHQLFIDLKKAYDSDRREVLYSILIEFQILRKLVGLVKMCLNETCSVVHIGKNMMSFLLKQSETRRCLITIAFQFWTGIGHQEGPNEPRRIEI
jgi:hypothetical protein